MFQPIPPGRMKQLHYQNGYQFARRYVAADFKEGLKVLHENRILAKALGKEKQVHDIEGQIAYLEDAIAQLQLQDITDG